MELSESLEEFKKKIRKVNSSRNHKIRNSLGVYDAYKYYRKNKPSEDIYILSESQYFSIIRHINNILADKLIKGDDINLPERMGNISLRKFNRRVYIDKSGKVRTNLPIDWNKTLELWYNDEEAHNKKILLRREEQEIFKIYYSKSKANYQNKSFYDIIFNKSLKSRLKNSIKDKNTDALLFGKGLTKNK